MVQQGEESPGKVKPKPISDWVVKLAWSLRMRQGFPLNTAGLTACSHEWNSKIQYLMLILNQNGNVKDETKSPCAFHAKRDKRDKCELELYSRSVRTYVIQCQELGVCAGWIGRVKANISIQSATSGLEKFQSATNPPKSKSGGLVTNFGGFNLVGYAGQAGWH